MKSPGNEKLEELKTAGRDFGGSESGNASECEGSGNEFSGEEEGRVDGRLHFKVGDGKGAQAHGQAQGPSRLSLGDGGKGISGVSGKERRGREESLMGRHAMADALGDADSEGEEAVEDEVEDTIGLEREERSVRGSVY